MHGEPTSPDNLLKTNNNKKPNLFKHLQAEVKPPAKYLILHYNKKLNDINDVYTIVEACYKSLFTIDKTHYSRKFNEFNTLYTIVELELHSTTSCEH